MKKKTCVNLMKRDEMYIHFSWKYNNKPELSDIIAISNKVGIQQFAEFLTDENFLYVNETN